MPNLLSSLMRGSRAITSVDDYLAALSEFAYQGNTYGLAGSMQQTLAGQKVESIPNSFDGFAQAMASNGVIFACMLVRMSVFADIRFAFQRINNGRPSEMFGSKTLRPLEQPWVGGTTQDLLLRMIQDADLSGNFYGVADTSLARLGGDGGTEIVRLRPDWVVSALKPRLFRGGHLGWRRIGYAYMENGLDAGEVDDAVILAPDEVTHFAPMPDPRANYRGMSWITPVIREVRGDELMERHKGKFFENGATPNMVVKLDPTVTPKMFRRFKAIMEADHAGIDNAYKTMYLGGGADAEVVGANLKDIEFKAVQGHGETRIAAAAGVPPVIVGLSEGLAAATYSNYSQARRRLSDGTMHPLWKNAAGSLQRIVAAPDDGSRLWYDTRDVAFLREDEKDASEIAFTRAQTIKAFVEAGYTPESVIAAVEADDLTLLKHSGLFSVQLQAAGTEQPTPDPGKPKTGGEAG